MSTHTPAIPTTLTSGDLLALVESASELSAELDFSTVLERVLSRACELTDSPDGSIMVPDPKSGGLYFAHAIGAKGPMLLERWGYGSAQRVPTDSVAGRVFLGGQANSLQPASSSAHFTGVDEETGKRTESMMCVLLEAAGERVGVIQILNKRSGAYTDRDLTLLRHFATQAALALRNAQLVRDVLANMGFFASRLSYTGLRELREELRKPAHSEVVSVLMADMRGFTRLCRDVERPEQAYELLNQYAGVLADAVLDAGGIVHKFLGDGIMALFRTGDHAARAVRAAFLMTQGFDTLKAGWVETLNVDISYVDIGIGITTDSVIVGTIGSGRVRDLTTVGTAVNLAYQYQDNARNGQRILVDKMTFRGTKDLIAEFVGPTPCQLSLPGQTTSRHYEQYHLKSLKGTAAAPAAAPAKPAAPKGPSVFVSYSHKDAAWLETLQLHLKPLLRGGTLTVWDDTRIAAGAKWREQITDALASASIGVLLVSPHFLASDFITDKELPKLLDAAQRTGLKILWIPVSASMFTETDIAQYQAALDPGRPLDSMSAAEQSAAWVKFCQVLKRTAGL